MSDAPDEPSDGNTRVQARPPSLDRYTPRSPASAPLPAAPATAPGAAAGKPAPAARPAPPGPPARAPCAATRTLLALRGSTKMPPMYCDPRSPEFVQVRAPSIDL